MAHDELRQQFREHGGHRDRPECRQAGGSDCHGPYAFAERVRPDRLGCKLGRRRLMVRACRPVLDERGAARRALLSVGGYVPSRLAIFARGLETGIFA